MSRAVGPNYAYKGVNSMISLRVSFQPWYVLKPQHHTYNSTRHIVSSPDNRVSNTNLWATFGIHSPASSLLCQLAKQVKPMSLLVDHPLNPCRRRNSNGTYVQFIHSLLCGVRVDGQEYSDASG